MSRRALIAILSAVLLAACKEDTLVSLNAVTFTKSYLSDVAESARHAAERTDILAARLAVFSDSTISFSGSIIAFSDSVTVVALLLAAADYDVRVAASTASAFFLHHKDEAEVIKRAYDAYDTRNARLASKAYEVARRTTDQTAATARRAADQAAAADSLQVATASIARRAAAAADSLQAAADSAQVVDQTEDDKVALLEAVELFRYI